MQVIQFTDSCPFLVESDLLSLSPEFMLRSSQLYDISLETSHRLSPDAIRLLRKLRGGARLSELQRTALRLGLNDEQLYEILGFLNLVGALQRSPRANKVTLQCLISRLRLRLIGIHYAPFSWRRPATHWSLLIGLVFACRPLMVVLAVTSTFFMTAGLLPIPDVLIGAVGSLLIFIGSMYLHELAHLSVIRRFTSQGAVLRSGMRFGLIHPTLSPIQEIYAAVSGPFVGALTCAVVAGIAGVFGQAGLGAIAMATCLIHTLSLLPWYGDGRSLKLARQRSKA